MVTFEETRATPRLRGGDGGRLSDSLLPEALWYRSSNQMGQATGKPEQTPPPSL